MQIEVVDRRIDRLGREAREAIARGVEHAPALRRGDAFDHAPERRHLGCGPRLIGLRARGIARDVERNDRGESAGPRIVGHTAFWVRVFPFGNSGNRLLPFTTCRQASDACVVPEMISGCEAKFR